MKIAIFGGTFDPVHDAHLAMAQLAASRYQLDRVLFVPAARPSHKGGAAHVSYADRLRMVELACQGHDKFEASRLEEAGERNYSIDTIQKLRAEMGPGDELFFIIGADAFAEIRTWKRWEDVVRLVRFLVVSRPGYRYDIPPMAQVERVDDAEMRTSSSAIRAALAHGENPQGLPQAVLEYIAEHGLYKT